MSTRIYPTVAETIESHRLLIDEFGGSHGLRDMSLLESAVLRAQTGYYADLFEEAAALMESLGNNHAFIDGNKRICYVMTDIFLRANSHFLEVDPVEGHSFIVASMERQQFRFLQIQAWLRSVSKPLEE